MQAFNFDEFAATYDDHRRAGGPFVPALVRLAEAANAQRALDIGCGTGNSMAGFHAAYPCALVGVDPSGPMLQHVREKVPHASPIQADACALPLTSDAIDFAFAVLVVQHIPDRRPLVMECARVLRPGGRVAFVTAPYDFIHEHVLTEYFPSFAPIDADRFGHEDHLADTLRAAGFEDVTLEYVQRDPEPVDARYLERVRNRFITTLQLIPDAEFQRGLARLEADVNQHGQLPHPEAWRAVVVSGRREE